MYVFISEPFLLDEKMLPILEEVEPPRAIPVHLPEFKPEFAKNPDTQYLLNEFETVYDVVELTHNTLTPPQSPPLGQPMLTNLEPLLVTVYPDNKQAVYHVPEKQLIHDSYVTLSTVDQNLAYPQIIPQTQQDIDHELSVVDELVRTRVEDMQWSSSSSSSNNSNPGSPGDSSNFGDCSSDDPEWVPETIDSADDASLKTPRKRRSYTKAAPEEKRVRKKEQNKNAATRYRLKKKAEVEVILTEERQLLDHNNDLGNQITDLQREIKYLKGLMRDLFKAKGLIN